MPNAQDFAFFKKLTPVNFLKILKNFHNKKMSSKPKNVNENECELYKKVVEKIFEHKCSNYEDNANQITCYEFYRFQKNRIFYMSLEECKRRRPITKTFIDIIKYE